jgi:RNA polymerase sigma-70 factor (ECF subfamily)
MEAKVPQVARLQDSPASRATTDEAIVALALHDRHAFAILYDRYAEAVYRYCYGRLQSREAAEDATSIVFSRALAALPTQRGPSFRAWLFSIAHNVLINLQRDAPRERRLAVIVDLADPGPPLEDLALREERRRSVRAALTRLPEGQRRVVELRLAGLTGPEIAAALGRSHNAVRSEQRRALATLRELLGITTDDGECRDAS